MRNAKQRIPLGTAQKVLLAFGIEERTREYERWIKDEDGPEAGFDFRDFNEVLLDSPFILNVDWGDVLEDDLEQVAASLSRLGVALELHLDEDGNAGYVSCDGRLAEVAYTPRDGPDFDHVVRALMRVVPAHVEFRASPLFEGSDGWLYAFLPREVWAELEREAAEVIAHYFPRGHRIAVGIPRG